MVRYTTTALRPIRSCSLLVLPIAYISLISSASTTLDGPISNNVRVKPSWVLFTIIFLIGVVETVKHVESR